MLCVSLCIMPFDHSYCVLLGWAWGSKCDIIYYFHLLENKTTRQKSYRETLFSLFLSQLKGVPFKESMSLFFSLGTKCQNQLFWSHINMIIFSFPCHIRISKIRFLTVRYLRQRIGEKKFTFWSFSTLELVSWP